MSILAGINEYGDDSDADQAFPADYDPELDDEELLRLQAQEAESLGDSGGAAPESVETPEQEVEIADPMAEYPEPEQRSIPLDVLLAKANYIREAAAMHRGGCGNTAPVTGGTLVFHVTPSNVFQAKTRSSGRTLCGFRPGRLISAHGCRSRFQHGSKDHRVWGDASIASVGLMK